MIQPPPDAPGVYVHEMPGTAAIVGVPTALTAFVGRFAEGPVGEALPVASYAEAVAAMGEILADSPVTYALRDFFLGGGTQAVLVRLVGAGARLTAEDYTDTVTGFVAVLEKAAFALLVIPPDQFGADLPPTVLQYAVGLCAARKAFLLLEPPIAWTAAAAAGRVAEIGITDLALLGPDGAYAAVYFPNAVYDGVPTPYPLTGAIAGIHATTDATRGVWTAPAGLRAVVVGATGLAVPLDGDARGALTGQGINPLLSAPTVGTVVWGARTAHGSEARGSPHKYVHIRRLRSYIEASVAAGLRWAVFEPNDEALWGRLRLVVGAFLAELFAQGAFAGATAGEAYFVTCDATNTTPTDQAAGIVNVWIGFAPLKPAEFLMAYLEVQTASG